MSDVNVDDLVEDLKLEDILDAVETLEGKGIVEVYFDTNGAKRVRLTDFGEIVARELVVQERVQ